MILNFGRINFQFLEGVGECDPLGNCLRDKGTDQSWQLFKATFLRAQELSISVYKKSGKAGWKLAWLSSYLLLSLRSKKGIQS